MYMYYSVVRAEAILAHIWHTRDGVDYKGTITIT